MKTTVFVFVMLCTVACTGYGARNLYDGMRIQQEMACQKLPGVEQDECFKRYGMSYDEYQRKLKERQKDK